MSGHLDHPGLAALEQHLDAPDDGIAAHVAGCAACGARLNELAGLAVLGGELRVAVRREVPRRLAPTPPRVVGYEDLRLISSGGQGVVWRARQSSTRRDVALKVLVGAQYAGPRTRARFEREIELAATLNHPHLVTVFDSGEAADGAQWFAMEFIEGRPFVDWARAGGARPERSVLRTFVLLCRAVDAAHRRGVLHRDIKSSNVLVDASGAPHVLDFGLAAPSLASELDEGARLTRTGEFMGTLAYASPEHLAGDPRRIEVRSDVYSLGVLGYEALTGSLPHDVSGSTLTAAQRILAVDIDRAPLRALRPDLTTVLVTALARDPERRYPTAGALADDIERYLDGRAIDARRDSALYVLRKSISRYRVQFAVTAGVFVLAVTSAVVTTTLWRGSEANRARSETEAARANELSGFWRSLFEAIDPERVEGRRLDVREVLDDAARRMREAPPSSGIAEMELAASIGRTYHKLARNDVAWGHLARATELAQQHLAPDHPRRGAIAADAAIVALDAAPLDDARQAVARLAGLAVAPYTQGYLRARLAQREGDLPRAEVELDRALDELARVAAPRDLLGACGVLMAMSQRAFDDGAFDAAEDFAARAVSVAERHSGPDGTRALYAKQSLAFALDSRGARREALALLDASVEGFRRRFGPEDTATIRVEVARAIVLARLERTDALDAELKRLVALRPRLVAQHDASGAMALGAIGDLAADLGDLSLALELKGEEIAALAALELQDQRALALAHLGAADVCVELRQAERALGHADVALAILEADGRVAARPTLRGRVARATAAALLGRLEVAESDARRAVELALGVHGDGAQARAMALRALALAQSMSGALADAEATLREAVSALQSGTKADSTFLAALRDDLGDVLLQAFRPAEAEVVLREALEERRRLLGPRHPSTADTANKLGTALFNQRKGPPDLPGLWLDALVTLEACGFDTPALASVLNNLGAWAHVVERDPERAEAYLRRGLEVCERVHGASHPLLAPSLANVALADLRHGDFDAAALKIERATAILAPIHGAEHPHVQQLRQMARDCADARAAAAAAREQR